MKPKFFSTQLEFRKWLEKNHEQESELLVGYYKVSSPKPSMTWPESVDQALCFGWIDGIRRSIDEESYSIRFTPRRPKSNWSAVNIRKIGELKENGLMKPAGLAAFEKRTEDRSGIYGYEEKWPELSEEFVERFRKDERAWRFFEEQTPYYKKTMAGWVMSAKRSATRERRLEKLMRRCERGEKIQ